MAAARKKGKYKGQNLMDEFLLNQLCNHVKYLQLNAFARHLGISQEEFERITAPNTFTHSEQILKVSTTVSIDLIMSVQVNGFNSISCKNVPIFLLRFLTIVFLDPTGTTIINLQILYIWL